MAEIPGSDPGARGVMAGEVQGLLGSYDYVARHVATRPPTGDAELDAAGPYFSSRAAFPTTPLPGYRDLKLYLNLDDGSGKVRGMYAEGNVAAVPVLKGTLPLQGSPCGLTCAGAVRWLCPTDEAGTSDCNGRRARRPFLVCSTARH